MQGRRPWRLSVHFLPQSGVVQALEKIRPNAAQWGTIGLCCQPSERCMSQIPPTRPSKGFAFRGVSVVTTTVPTAEDAQRLSQGAVQAQLAACAQVDQITSHYLWNGALQASPEWRLVFKTVPDAVQPLLEWLRSQHPYELPQLLLRGEQAQHDYGQWVAQSVKAPLPVREAKH